MSTLSMSTCVEMINAAAMSKIAAFQIELSVGLAVFQNYGLVDRTSKNTLCDIYQSSGYQCVRPHDSDYKTVNRRINATAELFVKFGPSNIAKWVKSADEKAYILAISEGIQQYDLYSPADVYRFCRPAKEPATLVQVSPHQTILAGPTTGHDKVVQLFRRAADLAAKGANHIETENLALVIPKTATRDELVEMAMRILELAESMKKELIPVDM